MKIKYIAIILFLIMNFTKTLSLKNRIRLYRLRRFFKEIEIFTLYEKLQDFITKFGGGILSGERRLKRGNKLEAQEELEKLKEELELLEMEAEEEEN